MYHACMLGKTALLGHLAAGGSSLTNIYLVQGPALSLASQLFRWIVLRRILCLAPRRPSHPVTANLFGRLVSARRATNQASEKGT